MRSIFSSVLLAVIMVSGCATDPTGRMAQSAVGATVGGAVGAGLGYAVSGNSQGTGRGAAAGAAAGALAGFLSPPQSYSRGYGYSGDPYHHAYQAEMERLRREEYYRWLQNEKQRAINDARRDYNSGK